MIQKIYNEAIIRTASGDDINKEIKKHAIPTSNVANVANVHITKHRKKEDIISLKDGILALK